jgi:hypothetical protein
VVPTVGPAARLRSLDVETGGWPGPIVEGRRRSHLILLLVAGTQRRAKRDLAVGLEYLLQLL